MKTRAWELSASLDNTLCQILALADLLGAARPEEIDQGTLPYVAAIFEQLGHEASSAVEALYKLAAAVDEATASDE